MNNPLRYTDPTGHCTDQIGGCGDVGGEEPTPTDPFSIVVYPYPGGSEPSGMSFSFSSSELFGSDTYRKFGGPAFPDWIAVSISLDPMTFGPSYDTYGTFSEPPLGANGRISTPVKLGDGSNAFSNFASSQRNAGVSNFGASQRLTGDPVKDGIAGLNFYCNCMANNIVSGDNRIEVMGVGAKGVFDYAAWRHAFTTPASSKVYAMPFLVTPAKSMIFRDLIRWGGRVAKWGIAADAITATFGCWKDEIEYFEP